MTFDGIQGGTADYSAAGVDGTDAYRFALQADVGSLPTGRYGWQMTITENYQDNSSQTNTYDGQWNVLNLNQSPLGQDWQFASLDWLVPAAGGGVVQADGSVGLVQGDGTMAFFAANGQGGWSSQPGPLAFTSLSRQIGGPQNGDFILEGTDGVKEVFDPSSGRLLSVTDRDGNTTSYAYNGSGQLTSVTNDLDETTVYAYSGGYLSTVTDYARRVTTLGYNSGQLVTIIQPDPQDSGAPGHAVRLRRHVRLADMDGGPGRQHDQLRVRFHRQPGGSRQPGSGQHHGAVHVRPVGGAGRGRSRPSSRPPASRPRTPTS